MKGLLRLGRGSASADAERLVVRPREQRRPPCVATWQLARAISQRRLRLVRLRPCTVLLLALALLLLALLALQLRRRSRRKISKGLLGRAEPVKPPDGEDRISNVLLSAAALQLRLLPCGR